MEEAWGAWVEKAKGHELGGVDMTYPILIAFGLFCVASIPYILFGGLFFAVDYFQPSLFFRRRLQPNPKPASVRSIATMIDCFQAVVSHQLLFGVPWLGSAIAYVCFVREMQFEGPLPSGVEVLRDVVVAALFNDFGFYVLHRMAHHPALYSAIHKKHHTYRAPFAWSSEFASVFELLVIDIVPVFLGPWFMKSHMFTMYVWTFLRTTYTMEIHCGMDLWLWRLIPFYGGAPMHELHHKEFNCNYGDCFVFWDKLLGTYEPPPELGSPLWQKGFRRDSSKNGSFIGNLISGNRKGTKEQ